MARPRKDRSAPLPVPETNGRRPGESDDDYYLRTLPKPPVACLTDDAAAWWMEEVFIAGGPQALAWAWEPHNWPLTPELRGRMFHWFAILQKRANAEAAQRAEARAQSERERQAAERQQRRREAGWA